MDNQERKFKVKETFNDASAGYDKPALRFFPAAAERLASHMALDGSEHILDVATGTGTVALACSRHLKEGHVTGIDLSEGMLDKARAKALEQKLGNVTFKCMDLEAMEYAADGFDSACCGFGIFFLPDMEASLKHIANCVKPGGVVGISSFTGDLMEPLSQQFIDRIQTYGIAMPPLSWKRLDNVAKLHALYEAADLENLVTHTEQVGYYLAGFEDWWDILWYSGFRGLLNQLSPGDLDRFRKKHQEEIEKLASGDGIWLNVEVLIAVGHKPLRSL